MYPPADRRGGIASLVNYLDGRDRPVSSSIDTTEVDGGLVTENSEIAGPVPFQVQDASQRLRQLQSWLNSISAEDAARSEYRAAFRAFDRALRETVHYMKRRRNGSSEDPMTEDHLSRLWSAAAEVVRPLDAELANRCFVKGQGWTDPTVWADPRYKKYRIGIDDMREGLMELNRRRDSAPVPSWFPVAGVTFAVLTFGSLFYLIIGSPAVDTSKRIVFDIWIAFCMSASASFLGGTASAAGKLPLPQSLRGSPIKFAVTGGIAVFIIVLILTVSLYR